MKRIIILVFLVITSSIFLKSDLNEKVDMNYKLMLGKEFYIYNVFMDYIEDKAYPVLQGSNYKVRYEDGFFDRNEYGYVEKLSKYGVFWVGFIPSYESVTSYKDYFLQYYIYGENKETLEDFENKMKKSEGYFVINKDIEKIGMSEEELLKYLNIKGIEKEEFSLSLLSWPVIAAAVLGHQRRGEFPRLGRGQFSRDGVDRRVQVIDPVQKFCF
mgnify:CR=1 FL=1